MACHPDRHPDIPDAEAQFKRITEAYETLSDVHKRAAYDLRVLEIRPLAFDLGVTPQDLARAQTESVLDTPVDDTLEELVVGNEPPAGTTLRTLFRDLERTENFILLRDGKEAFFTHQYPRAIVILRRAELMNPQNILVLYYLGRANAEVGRLADAEKLLRRAIRVGESRIPINHCRGVRKALLNVYRRRGKKLRARWLERENRLLNNRLEDEADAMAVEVGRAMARLQAERAARELERLTETVADKPRKQIRA